MDLDVRQLVVVVVSCCCILAMTPPGVGSSSQVENDNVDKPKVVSNSGVSAVGCSEPETPKHGVYRIDTELSMVEYLCEPDYLLIGSPNAVCVDGEWSSKPPLCLGQTCALMPVKHATIFSSHAGGLVRYQCRKGYVLKGSETLACIDDQWNGTQPSCIHRNDVDKMAARNVESKKSTDDDVTSGKYSSKRSHEEWLQLADYSCIGNDDRIIEPPTVANARSFTQWALYHGQARLYTTYRCKWGYVMQSGTGGGGSGKMMYCSESKWIGNEPKCQLFVPDDEDDEFGLQGDVSGLAAPLSHEQLLRRADYSCIGSSAADNVDPPIPDNARATVRFAVRNGKPRLYAEYTCADGFAVKDATHGRTYCKNGAWIGQRPACISDELVANGCLMNNGDCQQLCSSKSGVASCSCKAGYSLDEDGHTCSDVDECAVNNAGCQHLCDNVDGGFECGCYDGFQLNEDRVTCSRLVVSDEQ